MGSKQKIQTRCEISQKTIRLRQEAWTQLYRLHVLLLLSRHSKVPWISDVREFTTIRARDILRFRSDQCGSDRALLLLEWGTQLEVNADNRLCPYG